MQRVFWMMAAASCFHLFEEYVYPGGFLRWLRERVPRARLTVTDAVVINAAFLLFVASPLYADSRLGPIITLSIPALLMTNGAIHVIGTVATRSYSPGVITATLLYLPIGGYAIAALARGWHLPNASVAVGILLGLGWHTIPFVRGFLVPAIMRKAAGSTSGE